VRKLTRSKAGSCLKSQGNFYRPFLRNRGLGICLRKRRQRKNRREKQYRKLFHVTLLQCRATAFNVVFMLCDKPAYTIILKYDIVKTNVNIHPTIKEIANIFINAQKQVFLVGGAVRDLMRGQKAKDFDLATDALPEEVIALFHGKKAGESERARSFVVTTGIKHGTVTVHYKGLSVEVTTFRSEYGYSDGRRPDKVEFGTSIEADLSRRDFTMNAAAYRLPSGPLVDPFNGRGDVKKRLIRCVGDPNLRFSEDGLRPLRGLRFASQLDFKLDELTLAAIPGAIALTSAVAAERIREELDKTIASAKPSVALLLMEKTGLLSAIIPELAACRDVKQDRCRGGYGQNGGRGFHRFDVLDHSLLACDYAAKRDFPMEVRLAALYHDIGKSVTMQIDDEGFRTFHRHEKESALLTRQILLRLRYPNAIIDKTCHLIQEHMFHYEENWSDAAVRRFVMRVGEENLPFLYALRRADTYAQAASDPPPRLLMPLINRIEETLAKSRALSLKDLAVSGKDLIAMGVPAGKRLGLILNELFEAVVEDPGLNTKEKLLEISGNIAERFN
jgi:putative nucleotidyltransferase with HDIG domain